MGDTQQFFLPNLLQETDGNSEGSSSPSLDVRDFEVEVKRTLAISLERSNAGSRRNYVRPDNSKDLLKRLDGLGATLKAKTEGLDQNSRDMVGATKAAASFIPEAHRQYESVTTATVNAVEYLRKKNMPVFAFEDSETKRAVQITGAVDVLMNYFGQDLRPDVEQIADKMISRRKLSSEEEIKAVRAEALEYVAEFDMKIIDGIFKAVEKDKKFLNEKLTKCAEIILGQFLEVTDKSAGSRTMGRTKRLTGPVLWRGFMMMTAIALMKTYEPESTSAFGDEISPFLNKVFADPDCFQGLAFFLFAAIGREPIAGLSIVLRSVKNRVGFTNNLLKGSGKGTSKQKCQPAVFPWLQTICRVALFQYVSYPIVSNRNYFCDQLEKLEHNKQNRQTQYLVNLCKHLLGPSSGVWSKDKLTFLEYADIFQERYCYGLFVKLLVRSSQATKLDRETGKWYDTVPKKQSDKNQKEKSIAGMAAARVANSHQLTKDPKENSQDMAIMSGPPADIKRLSKGHKEGIQRFLKKLWDHYTGVVDEAVEQVEYLDTQDVEGFLDSVLRRNLLLVEANLTKMPPPAGEVRTTATLENPTLNTVPLVANGISYKTANEEIAERPKVDDKANNRQLTNQGVVLLHSTTDGSCSDNGKGKKRTSDDVISNGRSSAEVDEQDESGILSQTSSKPKKRRRKCSWNESRLRSDDSDQSSSEEEEESMIES